MKNKILQLIAVILIVCLLGACSTETSSDLQSALSAVETSAAAVTDDEHSNEVSENSTISVSVTLTGGSGKATVESPTELHLEADGTYTAVICWSSPNYDYMVVDGVTYKPVNTDGNSVFEIPVPSAECTLAVQADTVAMSQPHLIDYTLTFCGIDEASDSAVTAEPDAGASTDLEPLSGPAYTGSLQLTYAEEFTADFYEGGLTLITISGTDRYLLVPEGGSAPETLPEDITVLQQPLTNIYLVASGMMDMFAAADAMDSLGFCGLEQESWYVSAAVDAMKAGNLQYAGKYSAPDYEQLYAGNCSLAIENTMVQHSPEVVEELENLGIPVLIEHSSYEASPQGRMEWIKLCGLLTGHLDEAEAAFDEQISRFTALENTESTGNTAAFFYVTTGGTVSVRNASDYIPKMIAQAGGTYVFSDIGTASDNPTTSIQMEEFYAGAKDADFLIYNSTIAGEVEDLSDFLAISPLFSSMKAVKEGHVFCTCSNLYQSSMELGTIVTELHSILSGEDTSLTYFYQLK